MLLQIFGLETCNFREFRGADQADTMIPPEPWQPPQLPQGAMQGQKRLQQAEAAVRRLEKRIAELMTEKRMLELELYGDSVTGTLENRKPLQVPFPVDMLSDPNLPTAVSPRQWIVSGEGRNFENCFNKAKSRGGPTAHKGSETSSTAPDAL